MNKSAARFRPRPALELIEDAVRLLRRAPAEVLVMHFLGSAPCMLYAIYFFTDLSRSAFAASHVISSSLALAALYSWMKCWQAVAVAHLRAALLGNEPRWDAARLARLVATQVFLHPFGLLFRLAGATLAVPYVWTATFCQNVSVLGDGTPASVREVCAASWQEARRWPLGAHGLAGLLTLFGFFVYLNFVALLSTVPFLLKSFFGVETIFSQYLMGLLNPTFFVAVFALTYLFLDPIRKAAITLRCFHGRSLRTGEDLVVEVQRVRRVPSAGVAALVAVLLFSGVGAPAVLAEAAPAPVETEQLDRSIDDVLDRREFTWRAPREKAAELDTEKMTALQKWVHDAQRWAGRISWNLGRALKRWLDDMSNRRGDQSRGGDSNWLGSAKTWFWVVLAIAATVLAVLVARRWKRPVSAAAQAEAMTATPDLREEAVTADQLPEERWLQLAAELFDCGEFRLALRAFYLAGLAHLGSRDLILLAKYKSNRDYDRELRRRARAKTDLLAAFERNLEAFERGWYGDHAVTAEVLGEVSGDFERIRRE